MQCMNSRDPRKLLFQHIDFRFFRSANGDFSLLQFPRCVMKKESRVLATIDVFLFPTNGSTGNHGGRVNGRDLFTRALPGFRGMR